MAPKRRPPVDRFIEKVELADSGCMEWSAHINADGYGTFHTGGREGRNTFAHRWSYQHFVGEIPEGLHIDHLCRNRRCVNPDHLEPVSNRENLLRGVGFNAINLAKTHCPAGHPYDEANTYSPPSGTSRGCLTCRRERSREWKTNNLELSRRLCREAQQRRRDAAKQEDCHV